MHNPQQIHNHRLRIFDASLVVGFLSAEIGPTIFSCALKPENAVETWSNHRPHRIVCTPDFDAKKSVLNMETYQFLRCVDELRNFLHLGGQVQNILCFYDVLHVDQGWVQRLWRKHFRGKNLFTSSPLHLILLDFNPNSISCDCA